MSCSPPEPLWAHDPGARDRPNPVPPTGLVDHSGPRLSRAGPHMLSLGLCRSCSHIECRTLWSSCRCPQGLTHWVLPSTFRPLHPQAWQGPHPDIRMPMTMTDLLSGRAPLFLGTFFSTPSPPQPFRSPPPLYLMDSLIQPTPIKHLLCVKHRARG